MPIRKGTEIGKWCKEALQRENLIYPVGCKDVSEGPPGGEDVLQTSPKWGHRTDIVQYLSMVWAIEKNPPAHLG